MALPMPLPEPTGPGRHGDREESTLLGPMTPEQYDAFEAEADVRHEYVGGMAYAMSGGTPEHSLIGVNVAAVLRALVRGTGCRTYAQNLRLRAPSGSEYYPDVMVQCGPRPDNTVRRVETACLLVEVLSPSTTRTDTGEKLAAYRELPSLQAYWIVEATWRCVHRHWRDADGVWQVEDVTGDAVLPVPCLTAATLTLHNVYEDVELPGEPPRPQLRRVREPGVEYAVAGEVGAAFDRVDVAPAPGS